MLLKTFPLVNMKLELRIEFWVRTCMKPDSLRTFPTSTCSFCAPLARFRFYMIFAANYRTAG